MKEIKETVTIVKTVRYEANDGTTFTTEEECRKYEESAEGVINAQFKSLIVGDIFNETMIWEDYGYGNEEWDMAIIEIKDVNDLEIANRYYKIHDGSTIDKKYIGKRVLVNIGYEYERDTNPCPRTQEQLLEDFTETIDRFFNPKKED